MDGTLRPLSPESEPPPIELWYRARRRESATRLIRRIYLEYGIPVIVRQKPLELPIPGRGVLQATPVALEWLTAYSNTLETFFSRIPTASLAATVGEVDFAGYLKRDDRPAGSDASERVIYVALSGGIRPAPEVLDALYQGWAFLLLESRYREFPESTWSSFNPPGFSYTGRARHGYFGSICRPENWNRGFLSRDSEISLREDFSMYVRYILGRAETLAQLSAHSTAISNKASLARQFIEQCAPGIRFGTSPDRIK